MDLTPAHRIARKSGEFPRNSALAGVFMLAGLGGALVGAGVLLSTQFGPLVSFGGSILSTLASCF